MNLSIREECILLYNIIFSDTMLMWSSQKTPNFVPAALCFHALPHEASDFAPTTT